MAIMGVFGGERVIVDKCLVMRRERNINNSHWRMMFRDELILRLDLQYNFVSLHAALPKSGTTADSSFNAVIYIKSYTKQNFISEPFNFPSIRKTAKMGSKPNPPTIQVQDLTFAFPDGTTGLQNINLDLPAGSRTLLIGGTLPHPQ